MTDQILQVNKEANVRNKYFEKNKQAKGRTSSGTNWFRDEDSQVTKVVCIIAPIECYSGYMYFQ